MDSGKQNGWNEYSKLVLKELETLAEGIKGLSTEIQELKGEITELKAKEDRVRDIKDWKERMDEVASPSQFQSAIREIEELKIFKTKAVTIFAVVQFLMALALASSELF
tara:strand:+ start:349 stop:675 length:327 start_codon:yes stop_codon:yes gene_type:complete